MKKGRGQGGGPKISTKANKVRKTEAERTVEKRAQMLKRAAANDKKKPPIGLGRQQDRYVEQCNDGATKHPVFARPKGDGEWLHVGHVSVAAASELTPMEAAKLQKRLILEFAPRAHPLALQQQSEILECGLGAPGSEEEDSSDEPQPLEMEATGPLLPMEALTLAAGCGFMGVALPGGHYFSDPDNDALVSDDRKITLSKLGNNAKSAVEVQRSKTLGLRSLG